MQLISPFINGLGFTVKRQNMIGAFIVSLFSRRCPVTVFRAIVAIVILTIKRVSRARAILHIKNEVLNIMPTGANLNSASAIPMKFVVIRLIATLVHSKPNSIKRVQRMAVRSVETTDGVFVVASTAFCVAAGQFVVIHNCLLSAFAPTKPSPARLAVRAYSGRRFIKYGQAIKGLSRQICSHNDVIIAQPGVLS